MRPDSTISFTAYPMAGAALALAAGIVGAAAVGEGAWWAGLMSVVMGLLVVLSGAWVRGRRIVSLGAGAQVAGAFVALAGLGAVLAAEAERLPANHVAQQVIGGAREALVLTGRVSKPPTRTPRALRFEVDIRTLGDSAVTGRVQVTRFADDDRGVPLPAMGDVVRLMGTLAPPPLPRNPHDFDYGAYLHRRGLHATFAVDSLVVTGRERTAWQEGIARLRGHVQAQIATHVPTPEAQAVLGALLLGDRSRIDPAVRERFAQTGLLHLLAVSGLHVFLVAFVVYNLVRPTLVRLGLQWRGVEIARGALTLALLLAYVAVTGASASVVRAAVMATIFIGGVVLGRRAPALNTLGVAACVLLAARPAHLFEVGFQLSFAAVVALVTISPAIERLLPDAVGRWLHAGGLRTTLWNSTLATIAATLGTMPVLAWHFGHVGLAGLVLNLPAIPLTFATLAGGLLMTLVGGTWAWAASAFGASADLAARALLLTAEWGEALLGGFALHGYWRSGFGVAAFIFALVALVQWPRPRTRWRCVILAGALALVPLFAPLVRPHPATLDLLFFDVGQGDAALIRTPGGRHILVDAGDAWRYGEGEAEVRGDSGERTILPHLWRAGIRRLDAVVLSHPHRDHIGGVPSLLEAAEAGRLEIGRIIHSGAEADTDLFHHIQGLALRLGIRETVLLAGDTLAVDPAVHIEVLAPTRLDREPANLNDASLVLRVTYGTTTALLLGDAEAESEAGLVAQYSDRLAADIVKVGHHGSRTSSTEAFVAAVTPDSARASQAWAVVSVAARNRYRLPNADALLRWHHHGAHVATTAERGAVWLRSDGAHVEPIAWR